MYTNQINGLAQDVRSLEDLLKNLPSNSDVESLRGKVEAIDKSLTTVAGKLDRIDKAAQGPFKVYFWGRPK